MPRRDLYAPIHKAMRQDLFEVSALAARTDFDDAGSRARFTARFDGLRNSLAHHEEHEDTLVHPLLATADAGLLDAVEQEHDRLQRELEEVLAAFGQALDPGGGHRFYLALNRFVAAYLLHIDHEERVLMPAIWAGHDDDVLDAIARRDLDAPVSALAASAPALLALMNTGDRLVILRDLARSLSEPDLARVREAVLAALEADAADRLRARLAR